MFVHVNPVQIHFHIDSCLWFNAFLLNLHESLLRNSSLMAADIATTNGVGTAAPAAAPEPSFMYMDVKFEAIMPRIVFECPADAPSAAHTQRDRPKAMQLQISRVLCTNIRELGATRADLAQALHSLQEGSLVFGSNFPARPGDRCVVTDRILSHVAGECFCGIVHANGSVKTTHSIYSQPRTCQLHLRPQRRWPPRR